MQQLILVGRITCWSLIELKAFDHLGGETWKEVEDIGKIDGVMSWGRRKEMEQTLEQGSLPSSQEVGA